MIKESKKYTSESSCCEGDFCKMPKHHKNHMAQGPNNGMIYGLGVIGAAIFFIGKATSFWIGVLGLLKAIVWPAYLVYEALNFLIK